MYNKSQLSRDLKAAKEPKKIARPKDIDYVSMMGYRDDSPFNGRPYIDINTPDGTIDMSNTGIPLMANGEYLPPYSGMHQFDTDVVREVPLAEFGGTIMELDDDEIQKYRNAGYVVDLTPYPERHNPANAFSVKDPRSMQSGGTNYEKFRKMNLIDLNLDPQEAAKKYMSIDPELFQAYLYYKAAGYRPGTAGCSGGKCYYDEQAWKKFTDKPEEKKEADKPKPNSVKVDPVPSSRKAKVTVDPEGGEPPFANTYPKIGRLDLLPVKPIPTNIESSEPILNSNEKTLIKRYDKRSGKWVTAEVPVNSESAKQYQSAEEWRKKNPQYRPSSHEITPEELQRYQDEEMRKAKFVSNMIAGMSKMQSGGPSPRYNWKLLDETQTVVKNIEKLPDSDPRKIEYNRLLEEYNAEQDEYKKKMKEYEIQNRLYQYSQWPVERKYYGNYYIDDEGEEWVEDNFKETSALDIEAEKAQDEYYTPMQFLYETYGTDAANAYANLIAEQTDTSANTGRHEYSEQFTFPEGEYTQPGDLTNWDLERMKDIYETASKYPNFANKLQVWRTPTGGSQAWYSGDTNSSGDAFIATRPETPSIENKVSYEQLKSIYPNLSEKTLNDIIERDTKTDVSFLNRWYYGNYRPGYSTNVDISKKPLTSVVENGRRMYAPDYIDESYGEYSQFYPLFNEPEKVAEPVLPQPESTYEEEEALYTTSKVYDSDTNTWKDVVVPVGSAADKMNKEAEAWRQKNIEYQKKLGVYRDKESSHDPSNIIPAEPQDKKRKRKVKWDRGRYTFQPGGTTDDLYEDIGFFNIGDEVDEETMLKLKELGYEFE